VWRNTSTPPNAFYGVLFNYAEGKFCLCVNFIEEVTHPYGIATLDGV
jgi:hypothetical protein